MSSRPTAFITGIAGFAGSFLAEELLRQGFRVYGSHISGESKDNLTEIEKDIELVRLNILNQSNCQLLISKIRPQSIFHLAAISSVGKSFEAERLTFNVNFDGTVNMLEAARGYRQLKKFIFVSSADCYGPITPKNRTIDESMRLNPVSPYGISKAAAERTALYYNRQHRLPVTIARSFNHTGPRQSKQFVVPDFASQIAAIEAGAKIPVLNVGDLTARRDFSDVRDIVRGYAAMAMKGKPGEVYQLCSGRAVSIQNILNKLLSYSDKKIRVTKDKKKMRKADIHVLRGSNMKAAKTFGYKPKVPLQTTLLDTLNYWRENIGNR